MTEPEKKVGEGLSRRKLLRTIAASGGTIVAAHLLPDEWTKPVVQVGALPAFAQASPTPTAPPTSLTLSNLSRRLIAVNSCERPPTFGSEFLVEFNYETPFGGITREIKVHHSYQFLPSGSSVSLDLDEFRVIGNQFRGTISYSLCTAFGSSTSVVTTVSITDLGGRTSNQLSVTTDRPEGANRMEGVGSEALISD